MVAPGVTGGDPLAGGTRDQGNSSSVETHTTNRAADIASCLSQLKTLCSVLGINHSGRLKELGIKEGHEVTSESYLWMTESVITLKAIRDSRFTELRLQSKELIDHWKSSFRPLSKGIDLDQLYAVADAKDAGDINTEKLLSLTSIAQVNAEILRFKSFAETKLKDKYMARRKKLIELLKLSHISHIDGFDQSVLVSAAMYKSEAKSIKDKIKALKPVVLERKELVFRVEKVRSAIYEGQSTNSIDALVEMAKKAYGDLISDSDDKEVKYDGYAFHICLSNLWSMACTLDADLQGEIEKNTVVALRRTRTRTRSEVGMRDTEQTRKPDCVCNIETRVANSGGENSDGDRTAKDTKRILYLAFNVMNLEMTTKCYTDCFGMRVLEECQHNDNHYMFLGFEPEKTTLQLIHKHEEDGVPDLDVGQGFGHISLANDDVREVAKTVESSSFCKLVNQPCRLKGCSTMIAFASDPNDILFEIIQSTSKFEPICRLLLYVRNCTRSIRFYEKALGMRVLKMKDDQTYKMVCLAFGDEDKATVLELRTSPDYKDCDLGNVYYQMVIETEDVQASYEILNEVAKEVGAKILEIPTTEKKICCFEDPDGWRGVLVEHTDPDKLRHIL